MKESPACPYSSRSKAGEIQSIDQSKEVGGPRHRVDRIQICKNKQYFGSCLG
jgi:hypothetical protein